MAFSTIKVPVGLAEDKELMDMKEMLSISFSERSPEPGTSNSSIFLGWF